MAWSVGRLVGRSVGRSVHHPSSVVGCRRRCRRRIHRRCVRARARKCACTCPCACVCAALILVHKSSCVLSTLVKRFWSLRSQRSLVASTRAVAIPRMPCPCMGETSAMGRGQGGKPRQQWVGVEGTTAVGEGGRHDGLRKAQKARQPWARVEGTTAVGGTTAVAQTPNARTLRGGDHTEQRLVECLVGGLLNMMEKAMTVTLRWASPSLATTNRRTAIRNHKCTR